MPNEVERLPQLIKRALATLSSATSAAEILDAARLASAAYSAGKLASRLRNAKSAHDTVMEAARRCMGDALTIECRAMTRLADEFDAAQERGEVHARGRRSNKSLAANGKPPTAAQLGLSHSRIHEARAIRDAEKISPGVVHRAVEERLRAAETPTKEYVKRAVSEVSGSKISSRHKPAGSRRGARATEAEAPPTVVIDDVAQILDLIERVQSKYGADSPDIRALCALTERLVAVHVRDARGRSSSAGIVGARAEASAV